MRMTTSDIFGTELLLFPFWCLDTKGGEESIYLVIHVYVIHRFIWTWLVRPYLVCVGLWTLF
jgi:hypothetical protein